MFPSRAPFFTFRLNPRAAEIAAWAEEKEQGKPPGFPLRPFHRSRARGRPVSVKEVSLE